MELKKSIEADLERNRLTRWLLGLVVALAMLVTAMEFTSSESIDAFDDWLADEIPEDMEYVPKADDDRQLETLKPQANTLVEELVEVAETQTEVQSETAPPPKLEVAFEIDPSIDDVVVAEPPIEVEQTQQETLPLRLVEQLPQFPGGSQLLMKWLTKQLKYPESAKRRKIQGRVMVSFIIGDDGRVGDVKVVQGVEPSLDREAMRVIRMMPQWQPGVCNAKPCRTLVHLPIVFKL